jgi:cytokinin riboside 5'-monophosphate phosphoribohydrolase
VKYICVYCSSSSAVDPHYVEAAEQFGALLGQRRMTLVYGGASVGLMGRLAQAVHRGGGRVLGVIPQSLRDREIAYEAADELIVTREAAGQRHEGVGTLEEVLEVLTLKQLRSHQKPIVFLNTAGFYDRLLAVFEQLYEQRFTKADYRHFYHVAAHPPEVLHHLDHARPMPEVTKW